MPRWAPCSAERCHESWDPAARCPECEREFNLGEYRRPEENRGHEFQGYVDRAHFDKAMYAAAEQTAVEGRQGIGILVAFLETERRHQGRNTLFADVFDGEAVEGRNPLPDTIRLQTAG